MLAARVGAQWLTVRQLSRILALFRLLDWLVVVPASARLGAATGHRAMMVGECAAGARDGSAQCTGCEES